ncbi:energy-coupling factor transporter transmembrane component T family protein [Streptomyces mobaraensis]|uniref:Energy-coupling factor transporter transmembrane protein EcfT n=1 Tax=Streptomyces mobaraensis TaxID=35621 RepID=A0A5N5WBT7_STRMB|nr:energy-coupling factor transporter transmembrane protein EcfT [Streptomyces mobaraensis]
MAGASPARAVTPALHPGAWWLWALGLAAAASRTTNPLLLALLVAVAGYVVAARRTDAPWARSYGAFLKLGLVVIGVRLLFAFFLGSPIPGTHTVVVLPEIPLPDWARGVRLGGRVTAEGLLFALYDALRLAALLVCVGAANALANPARLLKSLPGALYEAGVAVVVAMTFAPNLVADVQRVRAARRLRGRPDRGFAGLLQVGLPVLEGALERSVALAAAMDARGYGRTAQVPPAVRRTTAVLTLGGLLGVCAGTYGLLADEGAGYGMPLLLAGVAAALAGLRLGGRRSVRTRYRPDRWDAAAWLVAGSGAAVTALMVWAGTTTPESLHPPAFPLTSPTLPLWPAASILVGLLPALPLPGRRGGRSPGRGASGRGRPTPGPDASGSDGPRPSARGTGAGRGGASPRREGRPVGPDGQDRRPGSASGPPVPGPARGAPAPDRAPHTPSRPRAARGRPAPPDGTGGSASPAPEPSRARPAATPTASATPTAVPRRSRTR